MNKDIAKQWAAELRSGKWKQARGALCRDNRNCCLGVLCEMAVAAGVSVGITQCGSCKLYDGKDDVLPDSVKGWAGMKTSNGFFGDNSHHQHKASLHLSNRNDTGATFPEIADLIEKHAEEL